MDERDLTRRLYGDPPSDPAARARARAQLDARVAAGGPSRRGWVLGVAAVLVFALVVSAIWSITSGGATAARALDRLASIDLPGSRPGPGEELHQVVRELRLEASEVLGDPQEFRVQVLLDIQRRLAADGSGEIREVVRGISFPTPEDEAAWSAPGAPPLPTVGDVRGHDFAPGQSTHVDPSLVPTDPDEIVAQLRDGSLFPTGGEDAGVLEAIGELLGQGDMPQPTRQALLEAASRLDGIELLGTTEDPLGRAGETFSVTSGQLETRLVFDPRTGSLLAIEDRRPLSGGPWMLAGWTAYEPASIVGVD